MQGIIEISKFEDYFDDYQVLTAIEPFDYSWKLDFDKPFADYLKDERRDEAERGLQEGIDLLDCESSCFDLGELDFRKDEKLISYLKENRGRALESFKKCKYVTFVSEDDKSIREYLNRNPILKSKFIVVSHPNSEIDKETLANIEKTYAGYTDRLMIDMRGNSDLVTYADCKKTVDIIEETVERIQSLDLSSLEAVMYAYDVVRSRRYVEEDEEEYAGVSRDLTSVLLGDKIVCTGFAHILNSILSRLGFRSTTCHVVRMSDGRGHQRVAVYIEDEKYGIKGVYFLDPTWDCKKDDTDDFLNSYKFFARTKAQMYTGEYKDGSFGDFGEEYLDEFQEARKQGTLENIPSSMLKDINNVSIFLEHKRLIPLIEAVGYPMVDRVYGSKFNYDEVRSKLEEYVRLMDSPVDSEVLLRALYNVRKIQYYENPTRFPFSLEAFYRTFVNSGWGKSNSAEERLLRVMYGQNFTTKSKKEFDELARMDDLERKIAMIKLARVLRSEVETQKRMVLK